MRSFLAHASVTLILILLAAWFGGMDKEDRLAELRAYCNGVESGQWPDYEHLRLTECLQPAEEAE